MRLKNTEEKQIKLEASRRSIMPDYKKGWRSGMFVLTVLKATAEGNWVVMST